MTIPLAASRPGEPSISMGDCPARCNLHLELLYGDEPHHIVEALFKAFARATDAACQRDPRIPGQLPSTKGKL